MFYILMQIQTTSRLFLLYLILHTYSAFINFHARHFCKLQNKLSPMGCWRGADFFPYFNHFQMHRHNTHEPLNSREIFQRYIILCFFNKPTAVIAYNKQHKSACLHFREKNYRFVSIRYKCNHVGSFCSHLWLCFKLENFLSICNK